MINTNRFLAVLRRAGLALGLLAGTGLMGCHTSPTESTTRPSTIDIDSPQPVTRGSKTAVVGEIFKVRLRAESGTGYTWSISGGAGESGVVNLVSREVEHDAKAAPGAPVWEVFNLRARKSGQTTVEFVYERPWERNVAPVKRFLLNVDVGY
jgi:inhibitor of cysteine peptidase